MSGAVFPIFLAPPWLEEECSPQIGYPQGQAQLSAKIRSPLHWPCVTLPWGSRLRHPLVVLRVPHSQVTGKIRPILTI